MGISNLIISDPAGFPFRNLQVVGSSPIPPTWYSETANRWCWAGSIYVTL